jgi:hypothetical protein
MHSEIAPEIIDAVARSLCTSPWEKVGSVIQDMYRADAARALEAAYLAGLAERAARAENRASASEALVNGLLGQLREADALSVRLQEAEEIIGELGSSLGAYSTAPLTLERLDRARRFLSSPKPED